MQEYNNFDELTKNILFGQFGETTATITSTTQYSYDQLGRMIQIVDGLNGVTVLSHDVMDRLVQVTAPNSGSRTYRPFRFVNDSG